ncbi:hypothetical protein [Flammeovirga sp. EKP202]|uniref:hypothetical protein n=1 Tax=Flammeovirga sp. EKP202 TaxID=2770592 RepID=UPI00165FB628|nr:hypothetical protein [Flammeovirga sp. EKP202]MBD0400854.1 hypothetical protein [Flammeovirga sp. EKP202]
MKKILTVFLAIFTLSSYGQTENNNESYEWPYSMPIWGKKAAERGYKIQLPYGLNVNYVYNRMDLEISSFNMTIGDDPNSNLNQLITEYVTLENLNFNNTIARTNGMNLRADVWVFPFLNVYGIYTNSTGTTEVSLQPRWFDEDGNLVISLPEVTSIVDFSANSYGFGTTLVGKIYKDYFFSVDGNITWSSSELLEEPAVFSVISARVGDRIRFKNGSMLALYVGGMYRGFVNQKGNNGNIAIQKALPNLGAELLPEIDRRVAANNEEIESLDPTNPGDRLQIAKLEKQNEILIGIGTAVEGLLSSDVNYGIQKDIINHWSVQFGFNYEVSENFTLRGEFGKGTGNDFVMMGMQYRFGI